MSSKRIRRRKPSRTCKQVLIARFGDGRIGFGGGLVMKRWNDSGEGGVKYGVDIMHPRVLETWKVNYSRFKKTSSIRSRLEPIRHTPAAYASIRPWFILLITSGIILYSSRPHRFLSSNPDYRNSWCRPSVNHPFLEFDQCSFLGLYEKQAVWSWVSWKKMVPSVLRIPD